VHTASGLSQRQEFPVSLRRMKHSLKADARRDLVVGEHIAHTSAGDTQERRRAEAGDEAEDQEHRYERRRGTIRRDAKLEGVGG